MIMKYLPDDIEIQLKTSGCATPIGKVRGDDTYGLTCVTTPTFWTNIGERFGSVLQ